MHQNTNQNNNGRNGYMTNGGGALRSDLTIPVMSHGEQQDVLGNGQKPGCCNDDGCLLRPINFSPGQLDYCTYCVPTSAVQPKEKKLKTLSKGAGFLFASSCCRSKFDKICITTIVARMKLKNSEQYNILVRHGRNYIAAYDRYLSSHANELLFLPDGVLCSACCILHIDDSGEVSVLAKNQVSTGIASKKPRLKGLADETNLPILDWYRLNRDHPMLHLSSNDNVHSFSRQETLWDELQISQSTNLETLAGCLFVPEAGILIKPHVGLEVTHAVGCQSHQDHNKNYRIEPGVFHSVVTQSVANTIDMEEFYASNRSLLSAPSDMQQSIVMDHPIDLHAIDPERWSTEHKSLRVRWIQLKRSKRFSRQYCVKKKGENPTREDLMNSMVLNTDASDGVNVTALLLEPLTDFGNFHLVAMIFHDPKVPILDISEENTDAVCQDGLLEKLLPLAGTKGMEFKRRGGSNGKLDRSKIQTLLAMLSTKGLLPRHRYATVLIAHDTLLHGYYIKASEPRSRQSASYIYTPPQVGGKLSFDTKKGREILQSSQLVRRFPACRVMTAKLIVDYNSRVEENTNADWSTRRVIERAAQNLLIDWKDANGHDGNPLVWMATKSEHTLLTHAVGLHCDYFEGNGKDAIENKIVLVSKRFSPEDDTSCDGTHDLGRGGLPTFHTWALLDWPSKRKKKSQVTTI